MSKRILFSILILCLATMACGFNVVISNTPAKSANPVVPVLVNNGFVLDKIQKGCKTPCSDYWNEKYQMLVVAYDNGMTLYFVPITDSTADVNVQFVGQLFHQMYPPEFNTWVSDSLPKVVEGEQYTSIAGYGVLMEWMPANPDKNIPAMLAIGITPDPSYKKPGPPSLKG